MSGPSSSPFLKLILSILTPFSLSNQQILGAKTDNFLPLGSISGSKAKKQTCKQKVGLFYGIKKKKMLLKLLLVDLLFLSWATF